jgi:hypothetical protein
MNYIDYAIQRFGAGTPFESVHLGGCRLDRVSGDDDDILDYKNTSLHNDIMRDWISRNSVALNSYPPPDPMMRQMMLQQRFITYAEYLTVFDNSIPLELSRTLSLVDKKEIQKVLDLFYSKYPAYELFGLANERERQIFINMNPPNFKGYCKAMKASQTHLATFFFPMVRYLPTRKRKADAHLYYR